MLPNSIFKIESGMFAIIKHNYFHSKYNIEMKRTFFLISQIVQSILPLLNVELCIFSNCFRVTADIFKTKAFKHVKGKLTKSNYVYHSVKVDNPFMERYKKYLKL